MADVHAETRRGLVVAAAFAMTAVIVGITRIGGGWWLPLHLFVVGGLLSAVSATTQMLAVTWSAAPAPRVGIAGAQRWAVAAGTVILVVGYEIEWTWMFVAGAATVILAMLALVLILIRIRSEAVTDRFAPAIEAYVAAVIAGTAGMSLGVVLGSGHAGDHAVEFRNTHLILNERLTAGFAITRSWVSLAAGNAAAVAAFVGYGPALAAALAVWLGDAVVRAARLRIGARVATHV